MRINLITMKKKGCIFCVICQNYNSAGVTIVIRNILNLNINYKLKRLRY